MRNIRHTYETYPVCEMVTWDNQRWIVTAFTPQTQTYTLVNPENAAVVQADDLHAAQSPSDDNCVKTNRLFDYFSPEFDMDFKDIKIKILEYMHKRHNLPYHLMATDMVQDMANQWAYMVHVVGKLHIATNEGIKKYNLNQLDIDREERLNNMKDSNLVWHPSQISPMDCPAW